jgi:hypothetical protein
MKKFGLLIFVGVVLVGAAYLAGLWPARQRLNEAQSEVQSLEQQVAETEAQVRLGEVLGELLSLTDSVDQQNYGAASSKASQYFDRVAAEARATTAPAIRAVLEKVQQTRDIVTAALARAEPTVRQVLREQQLAIREALGYDVSE